VSIRAVCVDRARIIRKEPSAVRVEGSTSFTNVGEQWFRARLFLTSTTDVPDPEASHWLSQSAPQVLAVTHDFDHNKLEFRSDLHIEIRSRQLGKAVWRMSGEPEPLRRKHRVIGWLLLVSRVIEWQYDDLLNENVPQMYVPFHHVLPSWEAAKHVESRPSPEVWGLW
jgi:hypothetical protein